MRLQANLLANLGVFVEGGYEHRRYAADGPTYSGKVLDFGVTLNF